jgi:hypothetical protein
MIRHPAVRPLAGRTVVKAACPRLGARGDTSRRYANRLGPIGPL